MIFIKNGNSISNSIIHTAIINGSISPDFIVSDSESVATTILEELKSEDAQKVERITVNSTPSGHYANVSFSTTAEI